MQQFNKLDKNNASAASTFPTASNDERFRPILSNQPTASSNAPSHLHASSRTLPRVWDASLQNVPISESSGFTPLGLHQQSITSKSYIPPFQNNALSRSSVSQDVLFSRPPPSFEGFNIKKPPPSFQGSNFRGPSTSFQENIINNPPPSFHESNLHKPSTSFKGSNINNPPPSFQENKFDKPLQSFSSSMIHRAAPPSKFYPEKSDMPIKENYLQRPPPIENSCIQRPPVSIRSIPTLRPPPMSPILRPPSSSHQTSVHSSYSVSPSFPLQRYLQPFQENSSIESLQFPQGAPPFTSNISPVVQSSAYPQNPPQKKSDILSSSPAKDYKCTYILERPPNTLFNKGSPYDSMHISSSEQFSIDKPMSQQRPLNNEDFFDNDSKFIQKWIEIGEKCDEKIVKISEVQKDFLNVASLLQSLEELKLNIMKDRRNLNTETVGEITTIKNLVNFHLDKIREPKYIENARKSLSSRKKQRKGNQNNLKKKKKLQLRKEKNDKIDNWRAHVLKIERDKLNENNMKREADKVFGEVRMKMESSNRMISLLQKLKELRDVRLKKMANSGQCPVQNCTEESFSSIQEGLLNLVKYQMKHYEMEEKTLQTMMEDMPERYSRTGDQQEVNSVLFGSSHKSSIPFHYTAASCSLDDLIKIRKSWDSYIDHSNSPMSSSVPITWVLPPSVPSSRWKKYAKCTK